MYGFSRISKEKHVSFIVIMIFPLRKLTNLKVSQTNYLHFVCLFVCFDISIYFGCVKYRYSIHFIIFFFHDVDDRSYLK